MDQSGHCWGFASGLRNTFYGTTCNNLDMAATIVTSPDASVGEKALAGGYVAGEAVAHGMLAAGSALLAGEAVAAAAPYASSAIAAAETTALAHPTASAAVGGVVETAVECSMTGGGCSPVDYVLGAATAGAAHRLSEPVSGIYEFEDLQNPGQTYVGQSVNVPTRLQQHIDAGRLSSVDDAVYTPISGNKFTREIAEQNRIAELGGIPSGKVSNIRNPIGLKREPLALQNGLNQMVAR